MSITEGAVLDFSRLERRKGGEGRNEKVDRRDWRGGVDGGDSGFGIGAVVEFDNGVSKTVFLAGDPLDLSFEWLSTWADPVAIGEGGWEGDAGTVITLGWTRPLVGVDASLSPPLAGGTDPAPTALPLLSPDPFDLQGNNDVRRSWVCGCG